MWNSGKWKSEKPNTSFSISILDIQKNCFILLRWKFIWDKGQIKYILLLEKHDRHRTLHSVSWYQGYYKSRTYCYCQRRPVIFKWNLILLFAHFFLFLKIECTRCGMETTVTSSKELTVQFFHLFWNLSKVYGRSLPIFACHYRLISYENRPTLAFQHQFIPSISAIWRFMILGYCNQTLFKVYPTRTIPENIAFVKIRPEIVLQRVHLIWCLAWVRQYTVRKTFSVVELTFYK